MEIVRLSKHNKSEVEKYLEKYKYELIDIKSSYEEFGIINTKDKKSGDFYGYINMQGEIFGIFLFDNKKTLYPHFVDDSVLRKVDLLKAIRHYNPLHILGESSMTDKIFNLIQRALKNFKYDDCYLMVLKNRLKPVEGYGGQIVNAKDYDFKEAVNFLIEVERSFGRNPRILTNLKIHVSERFEDNEYLFYLVDNKPVGQVVLEKETGDFGLIGGLYVTPKIRRNGISKILMSRISEDILSKGKEPILIVEKKNIPAVELYKSMGFEIAVKTLALNIEF